MTATAMPQDLEDTVRREALKRYLAGDEEQSLDLLAMAPRESAQKSKTSDSRASLRGSIIQLGKSDTK